jgi:large subunit ribosomal protein L9
MTIQVFLTQDSYLGKIGDLIKVAPGFARHKLFPNDLASFATPDAIAAHAVSMREQAAAQALCVQKAQQVLARIQQLNMILQVKTSPQGALYAAVHPQDVHTYLQYQGIDIPLSAITFKTEDIKTIGVHEVFIVWHGISLTLSMTIASTSVALV